MPKSGTTFLQRVLNLHAEISCPSEQSLGFLSGGLSELLAKYQSELRVVDRRTGGQGVPAFDDRLRDDALGALISALAKSFAGPKAIFGLKENTIIQSIAYFDRILDRPKMIAIFRDPIDTAVSLWRHNQRLAKSEPENASLHLGAIAEPTLNDFIPRFALQYGSTVDAFLNYTESRPNFLTLRYEALVSRKRENVRKLFRFLGADASAATIQTIVSRSTPEEMAKASTDPDFFRAKSHDGDLVGPDVATEARRQLRPLTGEAGLQRVAQLNKQSDLPPILVDAKRIAEDASADVDDLLSASARLLGGGLFEYAERAVLRIEASGRVCAKREASEVRH